jgi:uncharacterized membrane protein YagU involved in acid resistance
MAQVRRLAGTAAQGAIASMAMTGIRTMADSLGLIEETPPEAVLRHGAAELTEKVSPPKRPAVVQLAHWVFGATMAVVFALLPARFRRHVWAGPLFGALVWMAFESGIAPLLGMPRMRHARVAERAVLLADHLVYGAVIGQRERAR